MEPVPTGAVLTHHHLMCRSLCSSCHSCSRRDPASNADELPTLCVVSPRVESSPSKTSAARGPEAAACTPPPLHLRASLSPAAAGCRLLPRPQPTAVTSSSSVSAPWSLSTRWTSPLPSGTHCHHRACRLAVHCHGQPTLVSPSPPRVPNQPFSIADHLPDTSPPPPLTPPLAGNDRRRRAMGQAPAPFPYSTIGPPAHGWLGWFGWDGHFGPKEQCSLLFLLRILFKSIQNFKPSEIHRNSNKFDKNIN
jgi:hypothetical protein